MHPALKVIPLGIVVACVSDDPARTTSNSGTTGSSSSSSGSSGASGSSSGGSSSSGSSSGGQNTACSDAALNVAEPSGTVWALRGCTLPASGAQTEWRDAARNVTFSGSGQAYELNGRRGMEFSTLSHFFTGPTDRVPFAAPSFCAVIVGTYRQGPTASSGTVLMSKGVGIYDSNVEGPPGFWLETMSSDPIQSSGHPNEVGFRNNDTFYVSRTSSPNVPHVYRVERSGSDLTFSVDGGNPTPMPIDPTFDYGGATAPVILGKGHNKDWGHFNGVIYEAWFASSPGAGQCASLASQLKTAYSVP